jgi:hypothetical protein
MTPRDSVGCWAAVLFIVLFSLYCALMAEPQTYKIQAWWHNLGTEEEE